VQERSEWLADPLPWTGSSDLVGLAVADGLLALPAGAGVLEAGAGVEVVVLDGEPGVGVTPARGPDAGRSDG
jgi:molybdopterin biosynthesis enzyme